MHQLKPTCLSKILNRIHSLPASVKQKSYYEKEICKKKRSKKDKKKKESMHCCSKLDIDACRDLSALAAITSQTISSTVPVCQQARTHCYFTRFNLPVFLGIYRNPKQEYFLNSSEGFLTTRKVPSSRPVYYCKIASSNKSSKKAHVGFFKLLMKGFSVLMYCDLLTKS